MEQGQTNRGEATTSAQTRLVDSEQAADRRTNAQSRDVQSGIDSKLRGCDVVRLKVEDVAPHGHAADRATVRQKKTGQPVRFEMTEQTREAIDDYMRAANRKPGQHLFTGRRGCDRAITTRQYARLVGKWIASIGLDPSLFGTHSLRRTKATLIYRRTGNLRAVQLLLGHTAYCPRTHDGSQGPLPVPSAIR